MMGVHTVISGLGEISILPAKILKENNHHALPHNFNKEKREFLNENDRKAVISE